MPLAIFFLVAALVIFIIGTFKSVDRISLTNAGLACLTASLAAGGVSLH